MALRQARRQVARVAALAGQLSVAEGNAAARWAVPALAQGLAQSQAFAAAGSRAFHSSPSSFVAKGANVKRAGDGLIEPHGGKIVDLMVPEGEKAALIAACEGRVLELSDRNACDVELLMVGGFSPLEGFMDEAAYDTCVDTMKLPSGLMMGLPVVLDTDSESLAPGQKVLLKYKGADLAVIAIDSKWKPLKAKEAKLCYGTSSLEHPGVQMIAQERGQYYIGGKIAGLSLPVREFKCQTPVQVRAGLPKNEDVVAFQCRNPVHRAHYELFTRALHADNVGEGAVCLVHPTCGPTQDDDIPGLVRYHTYEVLKEETKNPQTQWAYLPYSMHMAGPREAIQHMIIRKNYGCTHFIIGRDMAGSKSCLDSEDFYGAYDAQDLAKASAPELGMDTVPSLNVVYTEEEGYVTADVAKEKGLEVKKLSGTKFRKMLRGGEDIPEWFAFKSVVKVLREHAKA